MAIYGERYVRLKGFTVENLTVLTYVEEKFITLYKYPLDKMRFSNCGNFLQGVRLGSGGGEPVFLHVASLLSQEILPLPNPIDDQNCPSGNGSLGGENCILNRNAQGSMIQTKDRTQISGVPEFSHSQGQLQISALTQDGDRGSVFLQTMRADGKMIEETILRLPKSSTLEKSYSALVATDDDDKNLRLVLNMAIQNTYSAAARPDFQLPAILDRAKDSIPVQVYTSQQRTFYSANLGKRYIKDFDNAEATVAIKKQR